MEEGIKKVRKIEKLDGRIDRVTGTRIIERLRVAPYCRVSTDSEEQKNSYNSQLKYYQELITRKPEWCFVDIYADEAISGTLDYKRSEFMRMINDALAGKIDLIITKSISRFARNTRDLLELIEQLNNKNVQFVSQKENIDTHTPTGIFMLTVFGAVAELEREYIRQRQREGIDIAKAEGKYKGRPQIRLDDFESVYLKWKSNTITAVKASKLLKISRSSFYRKVKEYEAEKQFNVDAVI